MAKHDFQSLWLALPLCCALGCAAHHSIAPTSQRDTARVYAKQTTGQGIITPGMAAPNGVPASQWQLAEEIRGLLTSDKTLAPFPSEVSVAVDKNTAGLVHLRGNIINSYERRKLRARIEQLPGVTQVDDQTVVGLQRPAGRANLQAPVNR